MKLYPVKKPDKAPVQTLDNPWNFEKKYQWKYLFPWNKIEKQQGIVSKGYFSFKPKKYWKNITEYYDQTDLQSSKYS